jgi:hypothetical protein
MSFGRSEQSRGAMDILAPRKKIGVDILAPTS